MADKKQNLWEEILSQSSGQDRFTSKDILVLGKKNAGKRTLFDQLHKISQTEFPKPNQYDNNPGKLRVKGHSSALDYIYLNVKNLEDPDDQTMARLGFSILEDENQSSLLKLPVNEKSLSKLMIIIMLDFQEPWNFISQLNTWIDVLNKSFENVDISVDQLQDMKQRVTKLFKSFKMPSENQSNKNDIQSTGKDLEEELEEEQRNQIKDNIPLPDGVLKTNIGIPILVVCNKSDSFSESNLEEKKIEFITYHLRQYCLNYGASLLYTSSKNNYNLDVFYDYILSVQYDFELKHKPEIENHECIFIPAGYDSFDLIKQNYSNLDLTQEYKEIIEEQQDDQIQKEEIFVKDDNDFFNELKQKKSGKVLTSGTQPRSSISRTNVSHSRGGSLIDANSGQQNAPKTSVGAKPEENNQSTTQSNIYSGVYDKSKTATNSTVDALKQKAEQALEQKLGGGSSNGLTQNRPSGKSETPSLTIQDIIKNSKNKKQQQQQQQQQSNGTSNK